jgi:hypothetical protein
VYHEIRDQTNHEQPWTYLVHHVWNHVGDNNENNEENQD